VIKFAKYVGGLLVQLAIGLILLWTLYAAALLQGSDTIAPLWAKWAARIYLLAVALLLIAAINDFLTRLMRDG
jgi:hypothetical protein